MRPDRDRILEQALKHELRAALPGADGAPTPAPALRSLGEGGCLDAETIAAWHDGGLDAAQMEAAELHASTCPHCQAMLAAFARGTPSTQGTLGTQGTEGTFRLWKWWLAPLAAGAAAVTLWMIVPDEQRLATAPAQSPATVGVDATAESRARAQEPAAPAESQAFRQLDTPKRDAAADQDKKLNVEIGRVDRQQLKDAAAPKEEKAIGAPPAAPVRTEEFAAGARMAELQKSSRLEAPIEIATLDPSVGWRIAGDRIERSNDGGKTWTLMRQSPGDSIAAGSAPSNSVCWFVGRGGRVLLTVNAGATFEDVGLSEPLDLASVAATDARSAMVYSVIGRRFRTEDGGRTWRAF